MPSSSSSQPFLRCSVRDKLTALFDAPANDVNHVVAPVALWIVAGWMLINVLTGTYSRAHLGAGTTEYTRVLSAAGMMAALLGITSYLTKFDLSRGFYVLLFVIGVPAARHLALDLTPGRAPGTQQRPPHHESPHRGNGEPRRRRRSRPAERDLARLRDRRSGPALLQPGRVDPAGDHGRRHHLRPPPCRCCASRPTSSSSPRAPSRRRLTSVASPGTSRVTTCRWRSCPASATSPPAG